MTERPLKNIKKIRRLVKEELKKWITESEVIWYLQWLHYHNDWTKLTATEAMAVFNETDSETRQLIFKAILSHNIQNNVKVPL
jgi:hypothetical protein